MVSKGSAKKHNRNMTQKIASKPENANQHKQQSLFKPSMNLSTDMTRGKKLKSEAEKHRNKF